MNSTILRLAGFDSRESVHRLISACGCKLGKPAPKRAKPIPYDQCTPAQKRARDRQAEWQKNNPDYKNRWLKKSRTRTNYDHPLH